MTIYDNEIRQLTINKQAKQLEIKKIKKRMDDVELEISSLKCVNLTDFKIKVIELTALYLSYNRKIDKIQLEIDIIDAKLEEFIIN